MALFARKGLMPIESNIASIIIGGKIMRIETIIPLLRIGKNQCFRIGEKTTGKGA